MAAKNPTDVAAKWAARLAASTQAIKDGVNAVTVAPTQKAAQKAEKYAAGVRAAVDSGRFQRGLQAVSLNDWQTAMLNKGVGRIASGTQAAIPKMQQFLTQFLPVVEATKVAVAAMPNDTPEQRDQRMIENARRLRQFKLQRQ